MVPDPPGIISRHRKKVLCIVILLAALPAVCSAIPGAKPPHYQERNKQYHIAYYEGGAYGDYTDSMRAIIQGLMHFGLIEPAELPDLHGDITKPYWNWLSTKAKSTQLSFSSDNAFSADWSTEKRTLQAEAVINRLHKGNIDLIIAMGTWAGQDLANQRHNVPTVVVSTSDPIRAGIIQSVEDSGLDHVTARVDQKRYLRQIRMFHRIVGFKQLGVAYEDSEDGRLYAAEKELEQVARERHFELVRCYFNDTTEDRETAGRDCLRCIEQIAEQSDAVYLTAMLSIDENIGTIAKILRRKKRPSFSMNGSKNVRKGILLSVSSDEGYRAQGLYDAEKIMDILNGARPRDLNQQTADPLDLAVNMDTAKAIGFAIPAGILRIAHKYYGTDGQ